VFWEYWKYEWYTLNEQRGLANIKKRRHWNKIWFKEKKSQLKIKWRNLKILTFKQTKFID
jgi:hypothetical protein